MPRTSPPFLPARKGENIFQRQSLAYRHYNIKKREKQQFTNFYAKRLQKFLDFSGNASAVAAALKERYALRSVFPLHCSGRRTHEPLIFVHNFFAKPCVFPCVSTKNTAIHPFPCGFPSFFTIYIFSTYPAGRFPQCGYFGGQPLFLQKFFFSAGRILSFLPAYPGRCPLSVYNFSTQKTPFFHPLFPRYRLAFCRIFLYNIKEHTEQFHNCTVSINKYYRLKIFLYILFGARKEEHS